LQEASEQISPAKLILERVAKVDVAVVQGKGASKRSQALNSLSIPDRHNSTVSKLSAALLQQKLSVKSITYQNDSIKRGFIHPSAWLSQVAAENELDWVGNDEIPYLKSKTYPTF
jgi:hypothetical protein